MPPAGGSQQTRTTPYNPASDRLVEEFNRMLLMILALFAGEHRDDWDDLLPVVMMAYHSSIHKSTAFSPYQLMFGEECTLPMDVGLPRRDTDSPDPINNLYPLWVGDTLELSYDQIRCHAVQAVRRQKRLYNRRAVKCVFTKGDWTMPYHPPAKLVHCQDFKKIPDLEGWCPGCRPNRPAGRPRGPVRRVGLRPAPLLPVCPVCFQRHLCLRLCKFRLPGHGLHPLSVNSFDAGPVRLASNVHAFNYRIAVLRDGAKPATRTARFRRAERGFLDDVSLPCGQQVAVMFQIVCALVLDVRSAAECLTNFHGVLPDVLLAFEPWGHVDHMGIECGCRSYDCMGAYVHALAFDQPTSTGVPDALLSQQTP